MVNKLSVAAVLTGMAAFVVPAAVAREFQTFEEYQAYERDLQESQDDRDMAKSKLWRDAGTFWNPAKAAGFKVDQALKDTSPGCAVAVYYDALDYRNGQKNDAGGKKDAKTWVKPLGIAPVCGNNVGPSKTYPGRGVGGVSDDIDSMLFSNYKDDTSLDTYLILRGIKDADLDKDCLKMEDFQGQQIQYGGDEKAVKKIWGDSFGDADLRDWFASYVQDTHAGCVLNPLKVARGDKAWSEYNWLGTFWGYDDKGLWKDILGNNKNIKKRSRAHGAL